LPFVHVRPIQVGEPRFDIPGRYDNGHMLVLLPGLHALSLADACEISEPPGHALVIPVENHQEALGDPVAIRSIGRKLGREAFSNELDGGAAPSRGNFHAQAPRGPAGFGQETPGKGFMLPVLAEQNPLYGSAHGSHPRATRSESLKPSSIADSASARAL